MATNRQRKTKRKRSAVATPSLAEMTVDDFMSGFGDSDDERSKVKAPQKRKKQKCNESGDHQSSLSLLGKTDPDFYKFLQDNDQKLLKFGDSGDESEASDAVSGEDGDASDAVSGEDGDVSYGVSGDAGEDVSGDSSDDDLGVPEPKPLHVTSRKEPAPQSDTEDSEDPAGGEVHIGKTLTLNTVQKWVGSIKKTNSLHALRLLVQALHSAIGEMLHKDSSEPVATTTNMYHLESASVFNLVVMSCLKLTEPCLDAHITLTDKKSDLPSSHQGWTKVKRIVKPYLTDLLSLMTSLQDPSMQCAVIRNIRLLAKYCVCLGKLRRGLDRQLIKCWSTGEHHVQVMAFLALREITLLRPHPSLNEVLKKLYLAFVRNCKFTSSQSLPKIRFMQNCLVELLSLDTPTTYQHGFVYIRQLAIHLRAAITSGKREAQQAVYNWQFVHCLDLWAQVLGHVTDSSLRPLIFPLVQVVLGTITLQPSSKYFSLRLHLIRTLVRLGMRTDTFIPIAPYLLEVLESHGTNVSSRLQTGKPPDLPLLLRATKAQLQSRAYQSALLNECFELLLEFSDAHSHLIGFPELMFPITTRIRKVSKATPYSWLRLQLQQLLGKVGEVVKETERDRERVDFSPNQTDKITVWEHSRKDRDNSISKFLATWVKVHSTEETSKEGVVNTKPHPSNEDSDYVASDNEDDIVEDFDISSADSD